MMFARTLKGAKRLVVLVVGLTVVAAGIAMLVTPGPGWLTILAGLAILATEFVWAGRLLKRVKQQQERITQSLFNSRQSASGAASRAQSAR